MISRGYVDILISVLGFKNLRSQLMTVILGGGRVGSVTPTEWWPSCCHSAGVMAIGGAGASVGTTHHLALHLRRVRRTSEVPGRAPLGSPGGLEVFPMRKNGVLPMEGTRGHGRKPSESQFWMIFC